MSHLTGDVGAREAADRCPGCGERPKELPAIEAVSSLRLLQRRSTNLARRGHFETANAASQNLGLASSATCAAARIPAVLAAADRRLRRLFGEPEPVAILRLAPTGGEETAVTSSLASVGEVAERLVRTIACATTKDWYHRQFSHDVSAAEVTWLAVHEATHYLEDVELALTQCLYAAPSSGAVTTEENGLNLVPIKHASHPSSQRMQILSEMPRGGWDDAS